MKLKSKKDTRPEKPHRMLRRVEQLQQSGVVRKAARLWHRAMRMYERMRWV